MPAVTERETRYVGKWRGECALPPVKSPSLLVLHFLVNIQFAQPLLTSGALTPRTENHKGRAANYLHVYFVFNLPEF